MSGVSGYTYNFEIYTGQENENRKDTEPNLGASANVVMRLVQNLPQNVNHRVYFDNYYTTVPLMVELGQRGIQALGTVRKNRLPNCNLPDIDKSQRGTMHEHLTTIDNIDISSVIWKDNKVVTLLSNFCGILPTQQVQRYDKVQSKKVTVDCPNLVKEYNRHMGGVDLTDSLIGRHKIIIKSKKWYFRMFYHLIDVTLVNAWLLYKRVHGQRKDTSKLLTLSEFRVEVAMELMLAGLKMTKQRGRRSNLEQELQNKKRRCPASYIPPQGVRQDQLAHWPIWHNNRLRCKFPKCKGYTHVMCEKCNASLCFNAGKNRFKQYHQ